MVRNILLGIVLFGIVLALASCNTVRGVGQDISRAGEVISDAASR